MFCVFDSLLPLLGTQSKSIFSNRPIFSPFFSRFFSAAAARPFRRSPHRRGASVSGSGSAPFAADGAQPRCIRPRRKTASGPSLTKGPKRQVGARRTALSVELGKEAVAQLGHPLGGGLAQVRDGIGDQPQVGPSRIDHPDRHAGLHVAHERSGRIDRQ